MGTRVLRRMILMVVRFQCWRTLLQYVCYVGENSATLDVYIFHAIKFTPGESLCPSKMGMLELLLDNIDVI